MYSTFRVVLPSGEAYWTVVDAHYGMVGSLDRYLLDLRFGMDCAESTTLSYAKSLALFTDWRHALGLTETQAARNLGRFIYWLQQGGDKSETAGTRSRGEKRINAILTAVRSYYKHRISMGELEETLLNALYKTQDKPATYRSKSENYREGKLARHRLKEPSKTAPTLSDEEVVALLEAATNTRDRFLIIAMWRMGLRRGEVLGLRLEDVHFMNDSSALGCKHPGPHVHVVRRQNTNGATAKSRHPRIVPADNYTVQFHDQYIGEKSRIRQADNTDYLFVNMFNGRIGEPMSLDNLNKMVTRLAKKADIEAHATPHIFRHSFSTNAIRAGAHVDVVAELLGHAAVQSTQIYLHASAEVLRKAVNDIPSPASDKKADK